MVIHSVTPRLWPMACSRAAALLNVVVMCVLLEFFMSLCWWFVCWWFVCWWFVCWWFVCWWFVCWWFVCWWFVCWWFVGWWFVGWWCVCGGFAGGWFVCWGGSEACTSDTPWVHVWRLAATSAGERRSEPGAPHR